MRTVLRGLIDRKAPGQPSRLDARHRAALAAMVENGPIPAVPRRRPLAHHRSLPMLMGRIRDQRLETDAEPGAASTLGGAAQGSTCVAGGMAAEGIASCRHVRATTRKPRAPSRRSKKLACDSGGDRARAEPRSQRYRGVVWRRSQDRPEEQDHPSLGSARHPPLGAIRPANRLDLYFRCHLPGRGQGCRLDPALVQHGATRSASATK